LPDRRAALACGEPLPGALRPPRPASCLRDAPPGARSVAERDWRSPGPSPSRYHTHLRQGGPRPTPPGRGFRSGRCAMNLLQLIERYIAHRQALGARFRAEACMLRVFGRSVGSHAKAGAVGPEQVSAFLAGQGPITRYWFAKYDALRGFYGYAVSRGYVASAPLPTRLPRRPPPFVPYIYSREELRRLFETAAAYQGCVVQAATL